MNLRLPRRVYDSETNLHYNYYRDYDAVLGRCATPDPLELIVGMNPYAYKLTELRLPDLKKYDQRTARKCRFTNLKGLPNKLYGYPKAILDTPGLVTEKTICE